MTDSLPNHRDTECMIRTKLTDLIRLSAEHGIDIEMLMYRALDIRDIESG